ncbi:MAG: hypothetical protein WCL00_11480 [Bacteroidota bacterium]
MKQFQLRRGVLSISFCLFLFYQFLSTSLYAQDFMMQGWYWDYPKTTSGFCWADSVRLKAQELGESGFTGIWLPPLPRASYGNSSNGYDCPTKLFGRHF